jgi:hypothetical protein
MGTKISILEMLLRTQDLSSIRLHAEGMMLPQRYGCAIAQTVSRWLPTTAACAQAQVRSPWFCGEQSGIGAGFLQILLVSSASSHFTDCSTFIIMYHPGLVQ